MRNYKYHNSEKGQAIVLLAFLMIVLLGFAGVAIDGGNLLTQRRRGQNAVDNAALGYALSRMKNSAGGDAAAATSMNSVLSSNDYVNGSNSTISYSTAATTGGGTVNVVLTATVSTAFIHIVYNGPVQYTVEAQAQWIGSISPMAGFAVVGMGNCSASGGNDIGTTGGGNSGGVQIYGGGLFVNSSETSGSHCAISPPNNGYGITVEAPYNITSVGGYNYANEIAAGKINSGGSSGINTGYNSGSPISDPLASLVEPTCPAHAAAPAGYDYAPGNWDGDDLGPGKYAPGIYCISNDDLTISGQNGIDASSGVVFYFKDHGMRFTGQAGLTLTAPTTSNCAAMPNGTSYASGSWYAKYGNSYANYPANSSYNPCTYAGMSIFVARNNTSTIEVRGNGGSAVTGTIYGLTATVQARGGGNTEGETSITGQVIMGNVQGNGNGSFKIYYDDPVVYHPPPVIRLTK